MVSQIFLDFLKSIRWDVVTTLVISLILYFFLLYKRYSKNRTLKRDGKRKKQLVIWTDFIFTIATSSTLYGGVSALYFAITSKLLFNQNFIISQEYMILFAGIVLIALGIITYQKAVQEITGGVK